MSIMGLWGYFYWREQKQKAAHRTKTNPAIQTPKSSLHSTENSYEPIRQTALVQADEFEHFYTPILKQINWYERLVGLPRSESKILSITIKALRLRKAAIFEVDSPESDRTNAPVWTLGLFLAINCRYAVRLLNSCEFTDENGEHINPHYEKPSALPTLNRHQQGLNPSYSPDFVYHHMIDKLISPAVIKLLHEKNVY